SERAADAPQAFVEHREDPARLRLEVPRDVSSISLLQRRLTRQPNYATALGDDRGRVCPRALPLVRLEEGLLHRERFTAAAGAALGAEGSRLPCTTQRFSRRAGCRRAGSMD